MRCSVIMKIPTLADLLLDHLYLRAMIMMLLSMNMVSFSIYIFSYYLDCPQCSKPVLIVPDITIFTGIFIFKLLKILVNTKTIQLRSSLLFLCFQKGRNNRFAVSRLLLVYHMLRIYALVLMYVNTAQDVRTHHLCCRTLQKTYTGSPLFESKSCWILSVLITSYQGKKLYMCYPLIK